MSTLRFRGGAPRPQHREYVGDYVHGLYEPAGELVFPLPDHAKPLVSPGDPVLTGQNLAQGTYLPCSCSGTVKAVERRGTLAGERLCVAVENDGKYKVPEGSGDRSDWQEMPRSRIVERIAEAGVLKIDEKRIMRINRKISHAAAE